MKDKRRMNNEYNTFHSMHVAHTVIYFFPCVMFNAYAYTHIHRVRHRVLRFVCVVAHSDEYLCSWINVECKLHTIIYAVGWKTFKSFDTNTNWMTFVFRCTFFLFLFFQFFFHCSSNHSFVLPFIDLIWTRNWIVC